MTTKRTIVVLLAVTLVAASVLLGVARAGSKGHTAAIPYEKGVLHALVTSSAGLIPSAYSHDVLGAISIGTGSYVVGLKKNVARCAITANVQSGWAYYATTSQNILTTYGAGGVEVDIYDHNGTAQNAGFSLILSC